MSRESRILRVVIDTNVLFSALALPKDSPPSRALALAREGRIATFVSPFILGELEKNLSRKAGWDDERLQALRRALRSFLTVIVPKSQIDIIKTCAADNRIIECAVDAEADALITGDRKDILPLREFRGIRIVTPREFMESYGI